MNKATKWANSAGWRPLGTVSRSVNAIVSLLKPPGQEAAKPPGWQPALKDQTARTSADSFGLRPNLNHMAPPVGETLRFKCRASCPYPTLHPCGETPSWILCTKLCCRNLPPAWRDGRCLPWRLTAMAHPSIRVERHLPPAVITIAHTVFLQP